MYLQKVLVSQTAWCNTVVRWGSGPTLARSVSMFVIGRSMVRAGCVLFALTMLTIHVLTVCHQLAPASAINCFNKGHAMYYHVHVIMHVEDP